MSFGAKTGAKPISIAINEILERAWEAPFTTRSDFARQNAEYVAIQAALGNITIKDHYGVYGYTWRITPQGLTTLLKDTHGL